ncbi:MAG: hypothetical protein M1814_000156 [Vezdaea aestivalis]|nr:MAG: hypothetical protein M1814_000156 [Vezdaea aestivalis]
MDHPRSMQEPLTRKRKGTFLEQHVPQSSDEEPDFDGVPRPILVPRSPDPRSSPHYKELSSVPQATTHLTQPTQILSDPIEDFQTQKTMILESSPPPDEHPLPSRPMKPLPAIAKSLSLSIAPAGTQFKAPQQMPTPQVKTDIKMGSATYESESSSDESAIISSNIKPTIFDKRSGKKGSLLSDSLGLASNAGTTEFHELTAAAYFDANPNKKARKLVSALKQSKQTGPARALPVQELTLEDVEDYHLKIQIVKLQEDFPQASVKNCQETLINCKGYLTAARRSLEKQLRDSTIDLTGTDGDDRDDLGNDSPVTNKRKVSVPHKKIAEKYGKNSTKTNYQAYREETEPITPPKTALRKGRIVQGRKNVTPPSLQKARTPPAKKQTSRSYQQSPNRQAIEQNRPSLSDDDTSDVGSGSDSEVDRANGQNLLQYLSTCTVKDLADLASIADSVAEFILSHRTKTGFKNLSEVRAITELQPNTRRRPRQAIGDKTIETCLSLWKGFEAVDTLVSECQHIGAPLRNEMQKWGVDVFGISKGDGTGLTSLKIENHDSDKAENDDKTKVENNRSSKVEPHDSGIGTPESMSEERNKSIANRRSIFLEKPKSMSPDVDLKDYQLVGLNWLTLLWNHKLSGILADDMGLGKTCQVIAFLAHLKEINVNGPHLIIVPGSTIENWLREFQKFCPALAVEPYYGSQADRAEYRENILSNRASINAVVTTYDIATQKDDNFFLRKRLLPVVCVYDEGHYLKNSKSQRYDKLMRIHATFRLLLTGTPLQNNLKELASLLGFILPHVFREHSEDLESIFRHKAKTSGEAHEALLSNSRVERAKSMLTPFVLRRKKEQVLQHLPAKSCRVELCDMTELQLHLYEKQKQLIRAARTSRESGKKPENDVGNPMMLLRKGALHPMLFRHLYDDPKIAQMAKLCLSEPKFRDSEEKLVYEDMSYMNDTELHNFCCEYPKRLAKFQLDERAFMESGKVQKLISLLNQYKANGDRVLVFSQFQMVLNIIELVLNTLDFEYMRLDGSTKIDERQDMIDQFYEDKRIDVFMLTTKAGGAGINLAAANKVIIFDCSFNPQDDIQAENRAHRVGQTRAVEVVRLITRNTVEELIYKLGETKLKLDVKVSGNETGKKSDAPSSEELRLVEQCLEGGETKDVQIEA